MATAAKAHCITTVNTARVESSTSAAQDGNASVATNEEDFDDRSSYYNLVYCLLQNRWRSMTANEIEMLMGYPIGYTRKIRATAAMHRLSKGIDVAVLTWVMWHWFAVGGSTPLDGKGRCPLGDPLSGAQHAGKQGKPKRQRVATGGSEGCSQSTAEAGRGELSEYEQLRQHNIAQNNAKLAELGLVTP